ncbi:hypothetical protein [Mycoplasma buteonis]|uniref:hypothetical protein n=1 Tax=Mycoplasma buteonis TaxID=171280 RepID=UPI00068A39A0|nr:hypothetical protein [Mycoplasma buteonis]
MNLSNGTTKIEVQLKTIKKMRLLTKKLNPITMEYIIGMLTKEEAKELANKKINVFTSKLDYETIEAREFIKTNVLKTYEDILNTVKFSDLSDTWETKQI